MKTVISRFISFLSNPMPQSQCTNLELSQELKKLGFPQESLFWHVRLSDKPDGTQDWYLLDRKPKNYEERVAAPTVAELLERLPASTSLLKRTDEKTNSNPRYYAETFDVYQKDLWDENPANALAKLRIYLLKNNLIEL